jgi:hypothetical protein
MKEVDKRFGVDLAGLNTLIPEAEIMPLLESTEA